MPVTSKEHTMHNIVELGRGVTPFHPFIQLRTVKSKSDRPKTQDHELTRFNKQIGSIKCGKAKPVVLDGLEPQYVENWSGVEGTVENARTIGFEDMLRNNPGPGSPTLRRGDVVVTDMGDHYLVR